MKTLICGLFLAVLSVTPLLADQAETVGQFRTLAGTVSIQRGAAVLPASVGATVRRGDVVRTGKPGAVGIVLLDDTTVSLGSGSEFVIGDYAFDPKAGRFSLVMRMFKGTFAYVAGRIGKLAPDTIRLEIPDATISVRGTKLLIEIEKRSRLDDTAGRQTGDEQFCLRGESGAGSNDDGTWLLCNNRGAYSAAVILVPNPDGSVGSAEVATAGGARTLVKAGDMTRVSGPVAPSAVTTADPAYIAKTFGEALRAEPPPPERFTLYFETGTTTLTGDSESLLPAIVAAIRKRAAIAVAISGHTDATGSDQFNDRLAVARAERVRDLLQQQGVAPECMSVSSHGKGNPAVPGSPGVPEPRNRRVEVIVK
jgi:outer membrane protein OmpA-like peptidoglycan-associated protein